MNILFTTKVFINRNTRKLWSDERFRFLAIGGFNTLFGFALFSIFQYFLGKYISIFGSLYLSHLFGSLLAFILYRKFVFPVSGRAFSDFVKFQSVYVVPLLTNSILLPSLIFFFGWDPYLSQAVATILMTLVSFIGHKYFSFRRPADISEIEMNKHGS